MTGIDELNYIKELRFVIESNIYLLNEMRKNAGYPSAIDTSIPKVSKVGSKGNYDWQAIQLIEQQEKINAYQEEFENLRDKIMANVRKMSNPLLREIIILHYIQNKELKDVALAIGYSTHIYKKHREAIREYENATSKICIDDLRWPAMSWVQRQKKTVNDN